MKKTFQPFIVAKAEEMIIFMKTDYDVFENLGIKSTEYTKERLCDILTEKLINGEYDENDDIGDLFPDDKLLMSFLAEMATKSDLDNLIEKGLVGSLDDDAGRDYYFVTEKGKECVKQMNNEK